MFKYFHKGFQHLNFFGGTSQKNHPVVFHPFWQKYNVSEPQPQDWPPRDRFNQAVLDGIHGGSSSFMPIVISATADTSDHLLIAFVCIQWCGRVVSGGVVWSVDHIRRWSRGPQGADTTQPLSNIHARAGEYGSYHCFKQHGQSPFNAGPWSMLCYLVWVCHGLNC